MNSEQPGDLGSSTAETLCDPRPDVREATLARLKEIYVSCEAGTSTTNPDVARVALPYAKRALDDPNPEVRVTGIHAIELLATDAGELVSDLARALVDPVEEVRIAALEALAELGPQAAQAAPQVAEQLARAPTSEERAAAACVLGNLRAPGDHLDALLDALLHDAPPVQAGAAHALAFALEDEREELRERVSQALHRLSRAK